MQGGVYSCKIVSRIQGRTPSLNSKILLYNSQSGEFLSMMDGDWITDMRTGAVAALALDYFKSSSTKVISLMGLGNIAKATFKCMLAKTLKDANYTIRLLRYKDQAEKFVEEFGINENLTFQIVDTPSELIDGADVVISAITQTSELICPDNDLYKQGILVIPVHTRGFQNCDLFFDKVFVDDINHVSGFKYFSKFKSVDEFSNVILGKAKGRESDQERILCYNIGLGIHDAFFASKIHTLLN